MYTMIALADSGMRMEKGKIFPELVKGIPEHIPPH
jgi:hypothetical protein